MAGGFFAGEEISKQDSESSSTVLLSRLADVFHKIFGMRDARSSTTCFVPALIGNAYTEQQRTRPYMYILLSRPRVEVSMRSYRAFRIISSNIATQELKAKCPLKMSAEEGIQFPIQLGQILGMNTLTDELIAPRKLFEYRNSMSILCVCYSGF